MMIVIEHKRLKRQISGSGFNLCGDPKVLQNIGRQILNQSESMQGFGWIRIREELPDEHSASPNTPPITWE